MERRHRGRSLETWELAARQSGRGTARIRPRARPTAKPGAVTRLLRAQPGWLFVEVRDDGVGNAAISPGGGLAGLRDRVQALDGTLEVVSPAGGPTSLRVAIPLMGAAVSRADPPAG